MKSAVIKTGGKQYHVAEKQSVKVEKLAGEVGDEITFDTVLLVADEKEKDVKVGTPVVEGATVTAKVVKQARAPKVTVLKYKAKTRYRKKTGHRQPFTEVEIVKIQG